MKKRDWKGERLSPIYALIIPCAPEQIDVVILDFAACVLRRSVADRRNGNFAMQRNDGRVDRHGYPIGGADARLCDRARLYRVPTALMIMNVAAIQREASTVKFRAGQEFFMEFHP